MPDRAVVIIGCGYAADLYVACLAAHPGLKVAGAYDIDRRRAEAFCRFHAVPRFESLADALDQDAIVANLTSIHSHHEVTRAALLRGRHVFSEKPIAETTAQAAALFELAEQADLLLSSAPSTALGPCHAAVRDALRGGLIGRPLVVHAALEDGPVHQMDYGNWISASGQPWPACDEFAAGPVLEHAGYQLTWLIDLFGGVTQMAGTTGLIRPSLQGDAARWRLGPNLALWNLTHDSGVVTRLSCGGIAPRDYSTRIFGDAGVLTVRDVVRLDSEVTYARTARPDGRTRIGYLGPTERLRYEAPEPPYHDTHYIDFAAGIAELAVCIESGTAPRLGPELSAHALEVTLELATVGTRIVRPRTRFRAGRSVVSA